MRRLEELLRQMCQAAKAIGNTELENKFAEGNNTNNYYYFKDNEKFIPIKLFMRMTDRHWGSYSTDVLGLKKVMKCVI